MKTLTKLLLCCSIVAAMAFSCEKDDDEWLHTNGYIVGFDPCAINHQYRIGYVIISADLKDTLITYNLSDNTYKMPASVVFNSDTLYQIPWLYFQNYWCTAYFPDTLRYKYGVRVSYRKAEENEHTYYLCTHEINASDFNNAIQVITKSATKY